MREHVPGVNISFQTVNQHTSYTLNIARYGRSINRLSRQIYYDFSILRSALFLPILFIRHFIV